MLRASLKDSIERIIRQNARFKGNEDLMDDFCHETITRLEHILESSSDVSYLEPYIKRTSGAVIIHILSKADRLKRVRSLDHLKVIVETDTADYAIDDDGNLTFNLDHDEYVVDKTVDDYLKIKHCLEDLLKIEGNTVLLNIFYLRYIKKYSGTAIAKVLHLTDQEVIDAWLKFGNYYNNVKL